MGVCLQLNSWVVSLVHFLAHAVPSKKFFFVMNARQIQSSISVNRVASHQQIELLNSFQNMSCVRFLAKNSINVCQLEKNITCLVKPPTKISLTIGVQRTLKLRERRWIGVGKEQYR